MNVRIRFTKVGKVRFTSHRDVARIWERAIRRAQLPVAYTEGFSPRPKLSFGLALSTGHESLGEYLDIRLRDDAPPVANDAESLAARLDPVLPDGLSVVAAAEVAHSVDSLQEIVTSCSWQIDVPGVTPAELESAANQALAAATLPVTRQRKGKDVHDDLRPALLAIEVAGPTSDGARLVAELGTQPRACRPAEFLAALDPTFREGRVLRTHQWTQVDGERREPLELALPPTGLALERAS